MVKRLAGVVLAICFAVGVAYGGVSGYQDLTRFLVNLPGWTAGMPEGVNMEGPQGKVVTATRSYKRWNQSLHSHHHGGKLGHDGLGPLPDGYDHGDS